MSHRRPTTGGARSIGEPSRCRAGAALSASVRARTDRLSPPPPPPQSKGGAPAKDGHQVTIHPRRDFGNRSPALSRSLALSRALRLAFDSKEAADPLSQSFTLRCYATRARENRNKRVDALMKPLGAREGVAPVRVHVSHESRRGLATVDATVAAIVHVRLPVSERAVTARKPRLFSSCGPSPSSCSERLTFAEGRAAFSLDTVATVGPLAHASNASTSSPLRRPTGGRESARQRKVGEPLEIDP